MPGNDLGAVLAAGEVAAGADPRVGVGGLLHPPPGLGPVLPGHRTPAPAPIKYVVTNLGATDLHMETNKLLMSESPICIFSA